MAGGGALLRPGGGRMKDFLYSGRASWPVSIGLQHGRWASVERQAWLTWSRARPAGSPQWPGGKLPHGRRGSAFSHQGKRRRPACGGRCCRLRRAGVSNGCRRRPAGKRVLLRVGVSGGSRLPACPHAPPSCQARGKRHQAASSGDLLDQDTRHLSASLLPGCLRSVCLWLASSLWSGSLSVVFPWLAFVLPDSWRTGSLRSS